MAPRCKLCNRQIDPRDMVYCRYCKTPYHLGCIKTHLYHDKYCPACGRMTSIAHYRRGVPENIPPAEARQREEYREPMRQASSQGTRSARKGERAPAVKKGRKAPGGGRILLFINLIIIALLLASTHYAHTTYVEYEPGLFADVNSKAIIPGQTAEFNMTLQNSGNILSRYVIFVDDDSVVFPAGWQIVLLDDDTTYDDTSIEKSLNPSEEYQFRIRISTTAGAEANAQGAFKIVARTKDGKYASSEIFNVTTEAIYNYELNQSDPQKYVSAGETAQFSAEIENMGNNSDTYYMRLDSITSGWSASLIRQQATIEANRSGEVILTMTAPPDAEGNEKGEVVLKVSSQYDPEDIKTAKYTLVVNPTYAFDITSSELSKEVLPGTTTNFTFKLRNLGNLTDTYDLIPTVSLPSGWEYSVSKDTVTLASEEDITLGLSIIVPDDSAGNLEGNVNLVLESEGNNDIQSINFTVTTVTEQGKFILAELFTSVNCTFCPFAENAMEEILKDYPGKVILLEHHINDSMAIDFSSERGVKYTIPGYPVAVFDGVKKEAGGSSNTYNEYVAIVDDLIDEEPLVRINITTSDSLINPGMTSINAYIKSEGLGSNIPLDVLFVTYRNGISPQGHSSKVYNFVSVEGLKTTISSLDSIETITVTMDIPDDGGLVVFVQDSDSNKVYQCVMI